MHARAILVGVMMLAGVAVPAVGQRTTPTPRAAPPPRAALPAGQGWLGVMQRAVAGGEAVVIEEVLEDSPASRARLQAGDTIVLWNGRRDVATAIRERTLEPGDTVRLRIRRGAQRDRDVTVVASRRSAPLISSRRDGDEDVVIVRPRELARELRLRSDSLAVRADSLHERVQLFLRDSLGPRLRELERSRLPEIEIRMRAVEEALRRDFPSDAFVFDLGRRSVAGAEFAPLNEGLSAYFGVESGVLVLSVAPETPAARAGLLAGDVVVEVNGAPVDDVAELRRLIARAGNRDARRVEVEVLRRGQRRSLEMRWE